MLSKLFASITRQIETRRHSNKMEKSREIKHHLMREKEKSSNISLFYYPHLAYSSGILFQSTQFAAMPVHFNVLAVKLQFYYNHIDLLMAVSENVNKL